MSIDAVYSKLWSFITPKKPEPTKSIYEKRIDCFQKMIELQKIISETNEEYITVSMIERKHKNAWKRLEHHQQEYRNLYSKCEPVIKPY